MSKASTLLIGGGDTGNDCIGTSVRHGAASVVNLELLPRPPDQRAASNPWPQWPKVFKIDYGHQEVLQVYGEDPRQFQVMSKSFIDDGNGNVHGIRIVNIEWVKDDSGGWIIDEIEGSERVIRADVVLLAMGFTGPEKKVTDGCDVALDGRTNFKALETSYETSTPGVFAAGDCRRGQSLVVWAIAEGRSAAASIHSFLSSHTAA